MRGDRTASGARARPSWELPEIGEIVAGKYRVTDVIGKGGLATVVAATHEQLKERVALKLLLPEWSDDPRVVERFVREARAATKIRSEHVVRVFDAGWSDAGAPYIVMEYLEGKDLDAVLSSAGPLAIETAVDYVAQACEAIAEAHAASIIHRDLKPANLFLTYRSDGSPCIKVIDFGISRIRRDPFGECLTDPSMVMGSPHYIPPEQLQSTHDADERSDVWALGAILHELLAGKPAFGGSGPAALANSAHATPLPLSSIRSDVPEALEATVLVALEKDPANRFRSVGELALAIASHGTEHARAAAQRAVRVLDAAGLGSAPGERRPTPDALVRSIVAQRTTVQPPLRRAPPAGAVATLFFGGLVGGALFVATHATSSNPAAPRADAPARPLPPAPTASPEPASAAPSSPVPSAPPARSAPTASYVRRWTAPPRPWTPPAAPPAAPAPTVSAPAPSAPETPRDDGLFEERK